jgi:glycogen phosphorylase
MSGSRFTLEVQPRIPASLGRLEELANNLVYSWDRRVRALFARLDRPLWMACGASPRLFLRRVAQSLLEEAAQDRTYMEEYRRVLSSFDAYLERGMRPECRQYLDPEEDLVAYFCAEFGLHESFPIYSGGLGILAGDHCKAASDLGIPFVAVGLLYHYGTSPRPSTATATRFPMWRPRISAICRSCRCATKTTSVCASPWIFPGAACWCTCGRRVSAICG